jgi:hypothetical protein
VSGVASPIKIPSFEFKNFIESKKVPSFVSSKVVVVDEREVSGALITTPGDSMLAARRWSFTTEQAL